MSQGQASFSRTSEKQKRQTTLLLQFHSRPEPLLFRKNQPEYSPGRKLAQISFPSSLWKLASLYMLAVRFVWLGWDLGRKVYAMAKFHRACLDVILPCQKCEHFSAVCSSCLHKLSCVVLQCFYCIALRCIKHHVSVCDVLLFFINFTANIFLMWVYILMWQ